MGLYPTTTYRRNSSSEPVNNTKSEISSILLSSKNGSRIGSRSKSSNLTTRNVTFPTLSLAISPTISHDRINIGKDSNTNTSSNTHSQDQQGSASMSNELPMSSKIGTIKEQREQKEKESAQQSGCKQIAQNQNETDLQH